VIYRFGPHALDTERHEFRQADRLIPLEPQVFDLLVYLIESRGRMVTRDEIIEAVWDGRIISDAAIGARINAVRTAGSPYIGEATRKSRFRRFPVGNYMIVYEVGEDEVVIHYVRHGARRRPWEGE